MTSFLLYLVLWIWDNRSFDTISQSNKNKSEAEAAYLRKDYDTAAKLYQKITYSSVFSDPASRLYLAHSYFQMDSLEKAKKEYLLLLRVADQSVVAKSNVQLGVMACLDKDTTNALKYFKTALYQDPENQNARYNFELLKKTFSGKVPPTSSPPPPPPVQPPPPAPSTSVEQLEIEASDRREELLQRLRKLNMSEEQARSILNALKSNEAQYIYQLRRGQYYNQSERSKIIEW